MRCYNGCPDDELQAVINEADDLVRRLREKIPDAHCTYFPVEGQYQVHRWGQLLSGFHGSRAAALREALS